MSQYPPKRRPGITLKDDGPDTWGVGKASPLPAPMDESDDTPRNQLKKYGQRGDQE